MDYRRLGDYYHREEVELTHQITSSNELMNRWRTDGLSFYRALARHTLGDPSLYKASLHDVQIHYLRVLADERNPYHAKYLEFDTRDLLLVNTFFGGLSCPDLCLGPRSPARSAACLLEVITNALNIRLTLWTHDMKLWLTDGPVDVPEYNIKFLADQAGRYTYCCCSLTPAEDGRDLINFLEEQRGISTLQIRRIAWWRNPGENGGYHCFNEYAAGTENPPDLTDNLDSLHVFSVLVQEPDQIQPALELMDEALKRAPGQEIPVSSQHYSDPCRVLKRYVAIDAEFKKVTLDDAGIKTQFGDQRSHEFDIKIERGRGEELCTVLTVAIDRQLVFSFYLLHMLENPKAETVSQISLLYERLLFNPDYLKIWFNFQSDIPVLDATLAHLYQGTKRPEYENQHYGSRAKFWQQPSWKIRSPFYDGVRPDNLQFPRDTRCDLHDDNTDSDGGKKEINISPQGLCCPCLQTANVDITTIIEYISRQLNYIDPVREGRDATPLSKRTWRNIRAGCNYNKFITWTMGGSRLHKLLNDFKEIPDKVGSSRTAFYNSIGPGTEIDDNIMAYNIGDVAGVALLMRFLTTTDDQILFAATLLNYCNAVLEDVDGEFQVLEQHSGIEASLEPSPPQPPKPYLYLNDFPKRWKRDQVGEERLNLENLGVVKVADVFQGLSKPARPLPYLEHENRAIVGRREWLKATAAYGFSKPLAAKIAKRAREDANRELFDPLAYTLPRYFSREKGRVVRDRRGRFAVIRSGQTPYGDYLALRRERRFTRNDGIPRGYLVDAGSRDGLPTAFERRPGDSLGTKERDSQFPLDAQLPSRAPNSPVAGPNLKFSINASLQAEARLPQPERLRLQKEREEGDDWLYQRSLDAYGPASYDWFSDINDQRGRNYRREWNRAIIQGRSHEDPIGDINDPAVASQSDEYILEVTGSTSHRRKTLAPRRGPPTPPPQVPGDSNDSRNWGNEPEFPIIT